MLPATRRSIPAQRLPVFRHMLIVYEERVKHET